MPDRRAMNALTLRRGSLRERLASLLRRHGYDPDTLDALPDPGDCPCELARAIVDWRAVNQDLDQAEARTSGWRY